MIDKTVTVFLARKIFFKNSAKVGRISLILITTNPLKKTKIELAEGIYSLKNYKNISISGRYLIKSKRCEHEYLKKRISYQKQNP